MERRGRNRAGQALKEARPSHKDVVVSVAVEEIMATFGLPRIDILKIDIKGAEKAIFERRPDCIPYVRTIVAEVHDRMLPGCTQTFLEAIAPFEFTVVRGGGNILFAQRAYSDEMSL